jgi:hypothetical protein
MRKENLKWNACLHIGNKIRCLQSTLVLLFIFMAFLFFSCNLDSLNSPVERVWREWFQIAIPSP